MRFGFKEEDMTSLWSTIRTSLVQKVTDVRKSEKRKSQSQHQTTTITTEPPNSLSDKQDN